MSHIHWVARQNKLEIPRDKDEVNKREIQGFRQTSFGLSEWTTLIVYKWLLKLIHSFEYDGRVHDPGTMVSPLTPFRNDDDDFITAE